MKLFDMKNNNVETHCNAEKPLPKSKFRNQYRIESTRLKNWDYSSVGAYFVTICTKNKEYFFGEIADGKLKLSEIGEMAAKEWKNTQQIRSNIEIDEWIVMPNHLHGIIINHHIVETHCNASLRQNGKAQKSQANRFGPQSNNLASIIRGFKGAATKNIHIAGFAAFAWQPGFYDRVIRDEKELNRIREYIKNNPAQWDLDINNPEYRANGRNIVETHSNASLRKNGNFP